jgi:membrane-bound lytic murein transglycosylase B
MRLTCAALAAALALPAGLVGAQSSGYLQRSEVRQFIGEMVKKHGFARKDLERIFSQVQFQPAIIKAMMQPVEATIESWQAYRSIFISPERLQAGVQFWNLNAEPLARASREFGVPEEIIVGIIGVETVYGRNIGSYRAIDALATLAFDYPKRAEFFRAELENYLVFTRQARIDPLRIKGSYAGAIGIPQFMPGTYRRFAVDYDGDGVANLAASAADAVGSIGNFLKGHGWVRGAPIASVAEVSGDGWRKVLEAGVLPSVRAADLANFGVKPATALPPDALCSVIELEGQPTQYRVGLQNFYVLTRYNRSNLYASAVVDLAGELARTRSAPPPPPAPGKENP